MTRRSTFVLRRGRSAKGAALLLGICAAAVLALSSAWAPTAHASTETTAAPALAPICLPTGSYPICVAAGYPCPGGGVCVYGYREWIDKRIADIQYILNCTINEIIKLQCNPPAPAQT